MGEERLSEAELVADKVASKIVSVPNILYVVGVANIGCLLFGYEVGAGIFFPTFFYYSTTFHERCF